MLTLLARHAPRGRYRSLALALVGVDAAFLVAHLLFKVGMLEGERWAVTEDRTYSEFAGYAKEAFLALLFAAVCAARRQPAHGALALVFVAFLADDALTLHERIGAEGGRLFVYDGPGAARGHDVAELGVLAAFAVAALGLLLVSMRPSDRMARRDTMVALAGIGVIFVFAALVDALHSTVAFHTVGVVEDGGEMVALSLLVAVMSQRCRPFIAEERVAAEREAVLYHLAR